MTFWEGSAAWVRARFPVVAQMFRVHTFDNRQREDGRRARQLKTGFLRRANCGVAVLVKIGDGRDRAYRIPNETSTR